MFHSSVDGLAAERVQTKEISAELQTLKEEAKRMAEQRVNDRHDFDAVSSFTHKLFLAYSDDRWLYYNSRYLTYIGRMRYFWTCEWKG